MKKVLYISSLSSKRLINKIYNETGTNPGFAIQKFNRLIAQGIKENGAEIEIYSKPPIGGSVARTWVNEKAEFEEGLKYCYVKYLNIPVLKDLFTFFSTFWKVFKFGLQNRQNKAVVCDVLAISMNIGAVLACKLTGVKIVGIVTDMPGLMVNRSSLQNNKSLLECMSANINMIYINSYTHYVFLTEQMNDVINTHNRPYIVMEALCDSSLNLSDLKPKVKANARIVMYAGGLHERYGLKTLVDAFRMIKREDVKLVIYGDGPFADKLNEIMKEDSRIEYRGIAPNEDVLRAELEASLLVNPRPTTEEFTKYSFPSKNMEYMVSGTPLLTTKLPGMPTEYYPYVYLFEEESVKGYADALNFILDLPSEVLNDKGEKAKKYVLENKNYKVQTSKVMSLIGFTLSHSY